MCKIHHMRVKKFIRKVWTNKDCYVFINVKSLMSINKNKCYFRRIGIQSGFTIYIKLNHSQLPSPVRVSYGNQVVHLSSSQAPSPTKQKSMWQIAFFVSFVFLVLLGEDIDEGSSINTQCTTSVLQLYWENRLSLFISILNCRQIPGHDVIDVTLVLEKKLDKIHMIAMVPV